MPSWQTLRGMAMRTFWKIRNFCRSEKSADIMKLLITLGQRKSCSLNPFVFEKKTLVNMCRSSMTFIGVEGATP